MVPRLIASMPRISDLSGCPLPWTAYLSIRSSGGRWLFIKTDFNIFLVIYSWTGSMRCSPFLTTLLNELERKFSISESAEWSWGGFWDEQDSVAALEIRLDVFQAPLNQIFPALVETFFFSLTGLLFRETSAVTCLVLHYSYQVLLVGFSLLWLREWQARPI